MLKMEQNSQAKCKVDVPLMCMITVAPQRPYLETGTTSDFDMMSPDLA